MFAPTKILFFAVDLVLFILGIIVLAIGTWILKEQKVISQLGIEASNWYHKSAFFIMGFGFVFIFFAAFGLWTVLVKSVIILCCFSVCCFFPLLMVGFALGIVWYIITNTMGIKVLEEKLRNYWLSRDKFKVIEKHLKCCGINGPADYNNSVPNSCIDVERNKLHRSMVIVTNVSFDPTKAYDNATFSRNDPNLATMLTKGSNNFTLIADGYGNVTLTKEMLHNTTLPLTTHINDFKFITTNIPNAMVFNSSEYNNGNIIVDTYSGIHKHKLNRHDIDLSRRLQSGARTKTITLSKQIYKFDAKNVQQTVFHREGCLDRIKKGITTVSDVQSEVYSTVAVLMVISFVIALILRRKLLKESF